jgi:SAM-dependent methyltransferase
MSQSEQADIETSSEGYARRFAGPAGEWLLSVQTRLLLDFLADCPAASVLDVGGGHGQAAFPLVAAGHPVTVLGSDPVCAARLQPLIDAGRVEFVAGPVLALPFPDNAFDVVVTLRLVPHCDQWPLLLQECCRVARQRVIIDYPCVESVNCLAGLFFEHKRKMEGNTRTWLTFRHRQIRRVLSGYGWSNLMLRKQFFWPMVVHRGLNRPSVSRLLEGAAAVVGLRALFGSPVLLQARPDRVG